MVSTAPTTPDLIHEQLSAARLQLQKWEPEPWVTREYAPKRKPATPSEWFSKMFPEQAKIYGCPFIEMVDEPFGGPKMVNPLAPNIDFLAAILGGDKSMGHKVVYFEPEMQFFFFDPRDRLFKPTNEAKLGNLLRALIIRCAEELPDDVHKLNLFLEFRSEKTIHAIVHRAKSILAADHTFFSADSPNERRQGPELHERVARVFVEQALERQPGEVLTFANAYLVFCEHLKNKGLPPVKRPVFKGMFAPLIRDFFDLGLRNDVFDTDTKRQTAGWKGLRALDREKAMAEA